MFLRYSLVLLLFLAAVFGSVINHLGFLVLFVFLFFGATIVFPVRNYSQKMIPLESITILTFAAYSLAVPLHHMVYRDYDEALIASGLLLCSVGGIGMVTGNLLYYLVTKRQRLSASSTIFYDWQRFYVSGWIIFLTGLFSSFLAIHLTVGLNTYIDAGYVGRALLKRTAGPIELGLYHTVFGFIMILLARSHIPQLASSRLLTYFCVSFVLIFSSYVSFLGIRRPTFFMLFSIIILLNLTDRRFTRNRVILYGLPAILLLAIFASFRQVLSDQGIPQAILFVAQNISIEWLDLSITELGAPFRVLLDVMHGWQNDGYRYGLTIVQSIPNLLPSFIGLDIQSLSEEYTVRNFSSEFISIGGNMGFFPVAEGYVNFGAIGVFVYLGAIGYVISSIQHQARVQRSPLRLLSFTLAAPWFVFLIRLDLASFTKSMAYSIVAPYVFASILYRLRFGKAEN